MLKRKIVVLIIDLHELIMQRVPVQRATTFLRSIKNAALYITDPSSTGNTFAQ